LEGICRERRQLLQPPCCRRAWCVGGKKTSVARVQGIKEWMAPSGTGKVHRNQTFQNLVSQKNLNFILGASKRSLKIFKKSDLH
jgi:hypothetical protein